MSGKLLLLLLLVPVAQDPQPRAIAKFCVNQVFHEKQFAKINELNTRKGCQQLIISPIPETQYYHAYSIEVLIGE